ncbi:hypothetical protein [Synechococcus sp. PCC 7336]|uniref:hypothetical protein n=1 Tax=Synechococcus sp. PCC 7336 TaxID=195250 RepID=UPI00034BD482|nr:hypothetical protein [Synechococcus sp. PCC 7336]
MKVTTEGQWVGIDVSKASLDIAMRPADESWQVGNHVLGWGELVEQLSRHQIERVVLESTGGMERGVVKQ